VNSPIGINVFRKNSGCSCAITRLHRTLLLLTGALSFPPILEMNKIAHNTAAGQLYSLIRDRVDGSVAEWLAYWTQAQKGPGSNRSRDAVG